MVEEVTTYLDSGSTRFTAATNLFANVLPHEPATVSAIIETGGVPPTHTFQPAGAQWENPAFQMTFRSTAPATARANAQAAWDLLDVVANQGLPTSTGTYYLRIELLQSPFLLKRDEQDRAVFAFNAIAMRTV